MNYIYPREGTSKTILDAHIKYEKHLEEAQEKFQKGEFVLSQIELETLWNQMRHSINNTIMPNLLHKNDTELPITPSADQIKEAFKWAVIRFEQQYQAKINPETKNRIFNGSYLANATAYHNFIGDISFGRAMDEYFRRVLPQTIGLDNQINNALLTVDNEWFKTPESERNTLFENLKTFLRQSPSLSNKFKSFESGEFDLDHALKYTLARMEAPDMLNVRKSKSSNNQHFTGRTIKNNPFANSTAINHNAYLLTATNYFRALTETPGTFPTLEEFLQEYQNEVIKRRAHLKHNPSGYHQ